MLRHIVTWNYKDEFTDSENRKNAENMKSALEALKHCIDGIVELRVYINELPSSNKDIILNSLFENEASLEAYQIHPEHQKVGSFVKTVMQNRACIDYYE